MHFRNKIWASVWPIVVVVPLILFAIFQFTTLLATAPEDASETVSDMNQLAQTVASWPLALSISLAVMFWAAYLLWLFEPKNVWNSIIMVFGFLRSRSVRKVEYERIRKETMLNVMGSDDSCAAILRYAQVLHKRRAVEDAIKELTYHVEDVEDLPTRDTMDFWLDWLETRHELAETCIMHSKGALRRAKIDVSDIDKHVKRAENQLRKKRESFEDDGVNPNRHMQAVKLTAITKFCLNQRERLNAAGKRFDDQIDLVDYEARALLADAESQMGLSDD